MRRPNGDDIVDAEIVPQRAAETVANLPAVRPEAGLPAVPEDLTDAQVFALATAWTAPTDFPRYWWANSLPQAIRAKKPRAFKGLILMALEDGLDGGEPVSRDEFEVALLEVDAKLAASGR